MNKYAVIFSLPYILGLVLPASGALRVSNASKNYNNYAAPITTSGATVAETTATPEEMVALQRCSEIYPNGEFAWENADLGIRNRNKSTCVARVELRMIKGTTDVLLASGNLSAGDSINCNISDFPESSYTMDAGSVVFPADEAPTEEDVINLMNEEQKKNAGLKIAAGTIIAAIGGNAAGKSDVNNDAIFGTNKEKINSTVLSGLAGAAIMTGNVYGGKVAGDVILSTGVNAAAGAIVGNMAATGDSVLRIEKCTLPDNSETKCLWGVIQESKILANTQTAFYDTKEHQAIVCDGAEAPFKNCSPTALVKMEISDGKYIDTMKSNDYKAALDQIKSTDKYSFSNGEINPDGFGTFVKLKSAAIPTSASPAMIANFEDSAFGKKMDDWSEWKEKNKSATIYAREYDGDAGASIQNALDNFFPLTLDADDGKIIDLSNKARIQSTAIGGTAGGALGGFTAYQGAVDEIADRFNSATRAYKDSLQKFYCATGKRPLGSYNETILIPAMPVE